MNHLPADLILDDIPDISLDARPRFLSSAGSGYPWRFLADNEEIDKTVALMLAENDCLPVEIGEESAECWSL